MIDYLKKRGETMLNKEELLYKLDAIIDFIKKTDGYHYKVYDKLCPENGKPDSNMVEYALDVKEMVKELLKDNYEVTEKDLPF